MWIECGGVCAPASGMTLMPPLFALSWASTFRVEVDCYNLMMHVLLQILLAVTILFMPTVYTCQRFGNGVLIGGHAFLCIQART